MSFATSPLNYKHPPCYTLLGMTGLDHATAFAEQLRDARRHVVDDITHGRTTLLELAAAPRAAAQAKVVVLAEAVPGVGKVRSRRTLASLGIADATRWGELSPEQLASLIAALEAGGASAEDGT